MERYNRYIIIGLMLVVMAGFYGLSTGKILLGALLTIFGAILAIYGYRQRTYYR